MNVFNVQEPAEKWAFNMATNFLRYWRLRRQSVVIQTFLLAKGGVDSII